MEPPSLSPAARSDGGRRGEGGHSPWWVLFDVGPAFSGSLKYQTTVGNLIGGVLLGAGAVMLIGCEIRSYMRIGMGYLNTWVGFMGFAIGYLPFTLFYAEHKAFLKTSLLVETYKWYDLIAPGNVLAHKFILALWWVALALLLVFFVRLGARATGASTNSLLHKNTEALQDEIDAGGKAHGGHVWRCQRAATSPCGVGPVRKKPLHQMPENTAGIE